MVNAYNLKLVEYWFGPSTVTNTAQKKKKRNMPSASINKQEKICGLLLKAFISTKDQHYQNVFLHFKKCAPDK